MFNLVGMKYKKMIQQRGLKITWVAKQVGISRCLLSQYINGAKNMPLHIEERLKVVLK